MKKKNIFLAIIGLVVLIGGYYIFSNKLHLKAFNYREYLRQTDLFDYEMYLKENDMDAYLEFVETKPKTAQVMRKDLITSLDDMVKLSQDIVLVEPLNQEEIVQPEINSELKFIYKYSKVTKIIKGDLEVGDIIPIKQTWLGEGYSILEESNQYLVFLKPFEDGRVNQTGIAYNITGVDLGLFHIENDQIINSWDQRLIFGKDLYMKLNSGIESIQKTLEK